MSYAPSPPSSSPVFPRPLGTDAPPTCEVPHFAPVRVRGGRYPLQRLVRHRRRAVAVGLAVTAAALVAAGPRDAERTRGHPVADPVRERRAVHLVRAPVRIADGATVRLLRPGDRVDVIASEETGTGGDARVVARGARVTKVPEALDASEAPDGASGGGALVVLSVPRATAADLAGASTTARLAVTLC
ncbi:RcpC/CpaB family pilus assembly protein [Streptomyces sp. YU58]|uniref:RcpC/CpaB family pilus assembly protein n=1 Tax=Streptomyces sp. SX92 TaxID=3158972 RepID=UPI0027B8A76D|nr:RcpC/CpaB family pilus assembly protein [Streptomyces coralus]WLW54372.1 RcpC/CpaB family pilus assembly protein [Streptomyces coralus]